MYDLPFFKHGNWLEKNVVGNWQFSPIYTYQTAQWMTVQSATDANGNGDSAADRAIFNPAGVPETGSGVTPLKNPVGDVAAYFATNPPAHSIPPARYAQ